MSAGIVANGQFWLQDRVARHPYLLKLSYTLSRRPAHNLVSRDTDLLIEGFPRSANTFAAWAFMLTNPECKLAHHVHTRSHVVLAVRRRIPAVVLLRPPADAVRSLLVRRSEIPPAIAFRRYIAFYEGVAPYTDQLVFARFDTVIEHYDRVVEVVNKRFGTRFRGFGNGIHRDRVFEEIDEANRRGHGGRINPRHVPRPHPERDRLKASTSLEGCDFLLQRAEAVHRRLRSLAV